MTNKVSVKPAMAVCNCGMEIRYSHIKDGESVGGCNKHYICKPYSNLEIDLQKANSRLIEYQRTINDIDDYFEYSMESRKDQKKIHQLLVNLGERLYKLG